MWDTLVRTQALEQPDKNVFELLARSLEQLEVVDEPSAYSISLSMRLSLAEIMGFGLPSSPAPEGAAVRVGISDGVARRDGEEGLRLSHTVYTQVLTALNGGTSVISEQEQMELEGFVSLYFSHHLDKRITSNAFNALR